EAESGTTLRLGDRRAGPPQTTELGPGRAVRLLLEERAGVRTELVLLRREAEVHQRLRGRPRTRSAMMFRRTSDVPASIELPRLRSCARCHLPRSITRSEPSSSTAVVPSMSRPRRVRRWFISDQNSLATEPSGPGTPGIRP